MGSALGALLWISSIATSQAAIIGKRDLVLPSTLPGSWRSEGCYIDVGRTLTGGGYTNNTGMTDESCIAYCEKAGYIYAGTEYAEECYCGNTLASGSGPAPTADCNVACSGNATEPCGGGNRLNLFWNGQTGPTTNPGPGLWAFSGCYTEGTTGRTLDHGLAVVGGSNNMSVSNCVTACQTAGYSLAGVEYSGECYCDNAISNGGTLAPEGVSGCSMLCNGNFSEYCGGPSRLDVYDFNKTVTLPPWNTTSLSSTSSVVSSSSTRLVVTTTSLSSSSLVSTVISTTSSKSSTLSTSTKSSSVSSSTSSSSKISSSSVTSGSSISSSFSSLSTRIQVVSSSSSTVSSSATAAPTLENKPTVGSYNYYQCRTEGTGVRALSGAASANDLMTIEMCAASCAGYTYFGTEYGRECYCGNSFGTGSTVAPTTDCSFTCAGNAYEYCGAGNRLTVYVLNGTALPSTSSVSSSSTKAPTGISSTVSVSSSSTSPASTGFPTGWTSQGCWVDGLNGRILTKQQPDNAQNTLESCVQTCAGLGYTIAGAEYGTECYCDNFVYNGGALAAAQTDCNIPCPGKSSEMCGAGGRISMYSKGTPTVYAAPAPQKVGLPTGWGYAGCIQDNVPSVEDPNEQLYTFPYKVWDDASGNTPEKCITRCQEFGFNAAGLEYGSQCFCGDVANIQVASAPSTYTNPNSVQYYTRSSVPITYPDSSCAALCTGNSSYICGDGSKLTYYTWQGATPLYSWGNPTGTDAGEYSLLIGGVVVPLIVSQVVTGKVTFVEKKGTGEPNGTGAYELDLSQINDFSKAWRAMDGLQTDVFCAGGLTLPDKVGRQLTVGGWAGDANYGVRLYWPDGSDGVPGTNGWVEDPGVLSLQVPRWYPSAMIMANGSILIVGGEIGQNAAEQPNLEILPPTGVKDASTTSGYSNTTVYLDFLDRTAPFNLYPFIVVLKSGIFIAYYNEARILDEINFQTIKELPNMPGAVNDPTGGRTYQLEGSMVILPQHAPYTDPVGVLICGGSTEGGGYPIDNCVSTQPEVANPTWTIERMPSRRVLPCMAGLPDGTYVILNGAEHGVAGFGLAGSPNLNAVIYDPSKPVNQRMSIMANTTVARLYHSEATVLLDGRVLVSGSDPSGQYVSPADSFPEEYRVEVFSPPYLLSGLPRPTFTITNKDWSYGQQVTFTVSSATNLKVSLLGSVVSTHGNAMGQRTIFPAVTCTGTTCVVTAPPDAHTSPPGWFMMFVLNGPTPSVGQFVRIGGDPAGLGNWPNLPPFDLPGI
ncbi:copper radical oxidase [Cadophora sp. DSE1049]|nr:copper radical oxidase [Cadophora sp. DSE1049]